MIDVTITDTYDDSLTLSTEPELEGKLYIDFSCGDCTNLEFEKEQVEQLRNALDNFLGQAPTIQTDDPNEAKLGLAAHFSLKAKFAYKGERDYRAETRRLEPFEVETSDAGVTYVGGMSYDDGGNAEGYRQFRLDRISGPVTIR